MMTTSPADIAVDLLHAPSDADIEQDVLIDCADGEASVNFMHPLRAIRRWGSGGALPLTLPRTTV
jgi:hypothetical protein